MKYREFIIPILSIAIVIVVLALYVWWHQELTETKLKSTETITQVQTLIHQREQGKQQLDGAGGLAAIEALLDRHLVQTETVVSFLQHIEDVGRAQNVLIEVSSVSDTADTGKIEVSLKASGSFEGIMRTLGSLENDTYALSAKNVTVTDRADQGWEMVGTLVALTYIP